MPLNNAATRKIVEVNVRTQEASLKKLASLAAKDSTSRRIRLAAVALTNGCGNKDDECELEAIFQAVKYGHPEIPGLGKGVRYLADPVLADFFVSPTALLELCEDGYCAEDCDSHAALVASICSAAGFSAGVRAFKPPREEFYTHVYPVVGLPKRAPKKYVGLDTTVKDSYVGWEPSPGKVMTVLIEAA